MIAKGPLSLYERYQRVEKLREEAKRLLDEADRIKRGIDKDEDFIWQAALKAKRELYGIAEQALDRLVGQL